MAIPKVQGRLGSSPAPKPPPLLPLLTTDDDDDDDEPSRPCTFHGITSKALEGSKGEHLLKPHGDKQAPQPKPRAATIAVFSPDEAVRLRSAQAVLSTAISGKAWPG